MPTDQCALLSVTFLSLCTYKTTFKVLSKLANTFYPVSGVKLLNEKIDNNIAVQVKCKMLNVKYFYNFKTSD